MFTPKTQRIESLMADHATTLKQMESLLSGNVNMYIDYANIKPWSTKLGWHVDLKRLKQFLSSFDNIKSTKIYVGTLMGDKESEEFIEELKSYQYYDIRTKPVKIMKFPIKAASIPNDSTAIIKQFIKSTLIKKFDIETIEFLNAKFLEMNNAGIYYIEDRKCNFDVEIGRDMLLDYKSNNIDTYALWSGDSDFADPIEQLLADGKKVVLFATARRIARELNDLTKSGLKIFDIQKTREFVCWPKEMKCKRGPASGVPKL